jgi:hypothetical protein
MISWYFSFGNFSVPPEHHVLEEMGETRLAGLDFVARSRLDVDVERDQVRERGGDDDDFQPVRKRLLDSVERKDVGAGILAHRFGLRRDARERYEREQQGKGAESAHGSPSF